ncbi:hypothetical protein [Natrarchaeobius chitinivorans]|uniref:CopG family transcriptional regulator n=1 Tax=Natrarchaeobius chitinivorans TaxID=1679083 RepID=A0A3N6M2R7_NATCH|nr:hypothetical protein [Natrarchaeobius chitinivorans]RQG97728.1 hypothetical protein EA473_00465 [Natrarchaeobius chitinivorans]
MAGENCESGGVSFALPADVDDWLTAEADRRDETRAEVCRRMIAAAHAIETGNGAGDVDAEFVERGDVDRLEGKLDAQREEFTDLLEDVRSRVVQVKRETDGKAPLDHSHGSDAASEGLSTVRTDLDELEERMDAGFDNFQEILEHLLDRTDELERRSSILAKNLAGLRDRRVDRRTRERERRSVERLQLAANRLGVGTATCEDCESSVEIALLSAPECPHCSRSFTDVAEKSSFFGSHRLVTGDPPPLEGRTETESAPHTDRRLEFTDEPDGDGFESELSPSAREDRGDESDDQ